MQQTWCVSFGFNFDSLGRYKILGPVAISIEKMVKVTGLFKKKTLRICYIAMENGTEKVEFPFEHGGSVHSCVNV